MKKILLILFFALVCFTTLTNAQVITKTASVSSAHVGEIFEYTIKISGVTNLSDLGKVVDVLDPSLTYISSDFATSSQIFAFYSMYCPSTISSLNEATSGTTHTFNFPASPPCSGSVVGGYGDFSFKIKVSVNEGACSELKIINSAKLYNQAGAYTFPILDSKIDIDNSNPWTLKKTFRSFTGGYLIYDIRLSSSVKHYNANVLPYTQFSDDFVTEDCMNVTSAGSEVVYIEDESNLSSTTTLPGATIAVSSGSVSLNWSLPTPTTSPTLSSYLFQLKIKVNCTCPGTFDLKNHVNLTATDICSKDFELNDDFDLIKATCKGAPPIPKVCVSKQVKLIDNDLNLTMSGCKGNYIIKIENCTDSFTYTDIVFTDVFPSSSLLNINTSGITISPATYSLTTTATSITLNSISTPLLPGQIITITIPFTVATPLPNEFIQNCADATITMKDGVRPDVIKTEHFCDAGIITVPNNVAIIKDKQICNPPIHTCGTNTINNNLPGDIVEYALHIYNYGTGQADNVVVTDNLPPYFNLLDVKVYKAGNYGNVVSDICTIPSVFEDITGRCAFPPIVGNKIQIKFSATDNLDKFTCEGVTHYIVKIKAKIAATVPNGSYTNVFETQYYDVTAGLTKSELSNPVTSVVNKDKLVIFDKHITSTTPDCVNKTSKVDYEIVVVNMGYDPIAVNIKDVLSVPAPLSLISGIGTIEYQITPPTTSLWNPLVSSGVMTATHTATTIDINNFSIPPCSVVKFRYSIVLNTNSVNAGQYAKFCNKLNLTVGYLVSNTLPDFSTLPDIVVSKSPPLINEYFDGKADIVKYRTMQKMKEENNIVEKKLDRIKIPIMGSTLIFVPIAKDSLVKCDSVTDCLKGTASGCLTKSGGGSFTFKINSINSSGQAITSLYISPGSPKVRKVEYILSDIRMLVNPCPPPKSPIYYICFNCSERLVGNFNCVNPWPPIGGWGKLSHQVIATPAVGAYREKNKVEFSNPAFFPITGTWNKNFQLPVSSLNCNGNLEVVITAIVYFEDCSICYASSAFDYHTSHTWHMPD